MRKATLLAKRVFSHQAYATVAFVVLFAAVANTLLPVVSAAAQLTSRSITMSDSGPSGGTITSGVGSGANVSYTVSFVLPNAAQSFILDFCSDSALIGTTCNNGASGMSAFSAASATVTNVTGQIGGWTLTASQYQIKLVAGTAATAGSTQTFTLNGITNPSTALAFYGRMYTWSTTTTTGYTNAASIGTNYVDFGAVALSTANVITITARVQETLVFCISAATPTNGCGGVTTPALTLGHGTNTTLDTTAVDTGQVHSQISTNAQSGAVVVIRNSSSVGGLDTSYSHIPPVGAGSATASAITAGTAAFGLFVATGTGTVAAGGTVTYNATYNTTANYGMDTTTSGNNVTTVAGSTLFSSNAPLSNYANTWTFAATAGNSTPAGIYTANIAAIATGTF